MAAASPMAPFQFLVGKWAGASCVGYLSGRQFEYDEEIEVKTTAKPLFTYSQMTWRHSDRFPMHMESGVFRMNPTREKGVDLLVAQGSGIVEVEEGTLTDKDTIEMKTSSIGRSSASRKPYVKSIRRVFWLRDGQLNYKMFMATDRDPEEFLHLKCAMNKVN